MKAAATCREEIVRAAIALKQDAGEISMRQIAKACGVAVGTVYHYFPDKTALLIAALEQVWREIFAPLMKPGLPGDALLIFHLFHNVFFRLLINFLLKEII